MNYEEKLLALGKDPTDYVQNAIEEILNHIFMAEMGEDDYDALIDELGACVKLEVGIEEDEKIKWDAIEDYVYHYSNTLACSLEKSDITAIFKSIKFENDSYEEIRGKIDTKKIRKLMIDDFKEHYSFDFERLYVDQKIVL